MAPNLLDIAIKVIPRARDWMFSSATPLLVPSKCSPSMLPNASIAGPIETVSSLAPSNFEAAAASSRLCWLV